MSVYREIRVRPVVRYIVTYFREEDHGDGTGSVGSEQFGEFANVCQANQVASALGRDLDAQPTADPKVVIETARPLKIHWLRGPGEPKEAIRWELVEE